MFQGASYCLALNQRYSIPNLLKF